MGNRIMMNREELAKHLGENFDIGINAADRYLSEAIVCERRAKDSSWYGQPYRERMVEWAYIFECAAYYCAENYN